MYVQMAARQPTKTSRVGTQALTPQTVNDSDEAPIGQWAQGPRTRSLQQNRASTSHALQDEEFPLPPLPPNRVLQPTLPLPPEMAAAFQALTQAF